MVLIKEIELALKPESNEVNAQEDEILADSVLQLTKADFTHVDDYENVAPGSIRKHVEADMRMAYPGKPTSRKRVFKSHLKDVSTKQSHISTEESTEDKDVSSIESDGGGGDLDSLNNESDQELESEPSSVDEDDPQDKSDSNESEGDHESDFDGSQMSSNDDDNNQGEEKILDGSEGIDIFSARTRNIDADIAKGRSIHNQLSIWDKLIECRIKLQPTLLNANKLYQKEAFHDFKTSLDSSEEEIVTQAYSTLGSLMKVLLELQENLLNIAPEYTQLRASKRKVSDDESNISESPSVKKNKSNKDLLEEIYEDFKPFRNSSIQKWNEKTRVSSGKLNKNDFSAFDLPTLKQIEEILLDRERLIRRTRTRRSDYNILGKSKPVISNDEPTENKNRKNSNEYDPEIFDDDDFYHKLLRDFIEKKTSDVTDVSKRGKQWLELQKLRSRMKSKVDTRASKGRKLRFTVHNKMVNFMAPVPSFSWSNEATNELFKSLFH